VETILKYKSYGKPATGKPQPKQDTEAAVEKVSSSPSPSPEKKKKKKKPKTESRPTTASSVSPSPGPREEGQEGDESSTITPSLPDESSVALTEQMKRLEELEKTMREREQKMLEATKHAEEKSAAIERALEMMEKRAKEEEFERAQRKRFLDMAAGSPYASLGPFGSSRPPPSSRLNSSRPPPSARSARDGTPRPKDAMKLVVRGVEWVQLWDAVETSWYWYCEASGAAQWEQPSEDDYASTAGGYESAGALTDYSTDNYESGGESLHGEGTWYGPWQEFWDESAQAKYWYNNETGEASWTVPEEYATAEMAGAGVGEVASAAAGAGDWVSYIDENTGQEYWYNPATGETSWG
jgi:hypothetical protein